MAESYVTMGLLSISIVELLVLQILHVSTLDVTATHLPYTRPQASCLTLPLHYRALGGYSPGAAHRAFLVGLPCVP